MHNKKKKRDSGEPAQATRARKCKTEDSSITPIFLPAGVVEEVATLEAAQADESLVLAGNAVTVSRKQAVAAQVAEVYNLKPAAARTGVSLRQIYNWMESDPDFQALLDEARQQKCHDVEEALLAIGMGERKGQPMPLLAWLNAHHPEYGRIRKETLDRVIQPFLKEICQIAARHIPAASAQQFGEELFRAAARKVRGAIT